MVPLSVPASSLAEALVAFALAPAAEALRDDYMHRAERRGQLEIVAVHITIFECG